MVPARALRETVGQDADEFGAPGPSVGTTSGRDARTGASAPRPSRLSASSVMTWWYSRHDPQPAPQAQANLAIQDAVALAEHLRGAGPGDIPAALRHYSDVRAPFAAEIQRKSRELSPFARLKSESD